MSPSFLKYILTLFEFSSLNLILVLGYFERHQLEGEKVVVSFHCPQGKCQGKKEVLQKTIK